MIFKPLSFRRKLVLVFVSLSLLIQGVQLFAFYQTTDENVRAQVSDALETASRIFQRTYRDRLGQLQSVVEIYSTDEGLEQAFAAGDQPTLQSALSSAYRRYNRTGLSVLAAFDPEGTLITSVSPAASYDLAPLGTLLDEDPPAGNSADILIVTGGAALQFVVAPVEAPNFLGWVVAGLVLDGAAAKDIKDLSALALDIAFVFQADDAGMLAASNSSSGGFLKPYLRTAKPTMSDPDQTIRLAGEDYLRRWVPVNGGKAPRPVYALLYTSVGAAYAPYEPLVLTLSGVALISLLVLIIGSQAVAGGISRPIARLAEASKRLAGGDYELSEHFDRKTDDEIGVLTQGFRQMVTAIKDREDHIRHQAMHDPETGLPNRPSFEGQLDTLMDGQSRFGVLVIGIENLHGLRSTLPIDQTTRLVKQVGRKLRDTPNTGIASLAFGSFAMILRREDDVDQMLDLLHQIFEHPILVDDVSVDIRLSIGAAQYPTDGEDHASLLRCAHAAQDLARTSPSRCARYAAEDDTAKIGHLSLMSDLRTGIEDGEVWFAYQPKLCLMSGQVTAAEALVRWVSEVRGFVPPDDFIPLAEQTGEIRNLTRWGLHTVIAEAARWSADGHAIQVGFNLSANDLLSGDLPNLVDSLLRRAKLDAAQLYLEVTESAVMQDTERSLAVLSMLSRMGVKLAIDDYGTGYSSLSYLKQLPVQELKIDRAFVTHLATDKQDQILVRSTIEMAHSLGLKVTAEGVEDEQSLALLRDYGCDYAQGYFIARPVPSAEFLETVRAVDTQAAE